MSEQYPLLCDELSEEERFSPRYRRLLMSRARAKNHVKGAAHIIARWPGHWTTVLNYWWIGIGMLAITTYILYNCLFSYAMLQTSNRSYGSRSNNIRKFKPISPVTPVLQPKVFMHIFTDEKQEVDLNNYLPYIDIITKKYQHFKYHLIIVGNDFHAETKDLSDEDNNRLALNSLWYNADNNKIKSGYGNLHIKYTTLTKCFSDSPLDKFWRNLPNQFLKFLVRSVSIWEKGGIAFDPIILTPQSPNSIYIDKVYRILKKYNTEKEKLSTKQFKYHKKINKSSKVVPNNIQDVIHALENDSATEKIIQESLEEVETKDNVAITHIRNSRSPVDMTETKKNITTLKSKETKNLELHLNQEKQLDNSPKLNLLPMFLNYLFNKKEMKSTDNLSSHEIMYADKNQVPKDIAPNNKNKTHNIQEFWNNITDKNNYRPVIVSAKGIIDKPLNGTNAESFTEKEDLSYEVTIDLKGNIIATDTVCHAFIGGMFSNAIHHEQSETVTEFIIKELSIFCKGLFSACVGIDVILL